MRVLILTHNYPRFTGDAAGAFVARLARGVAAQGHDVLVLAPHAADTAARESHGSLEVRRFRFGPAAVERIAYRGTLHQRSILSPVTAARIAALMTAFARATARARRDFRPDLIHAHWWMPSGVIAAMQPAPLVVTSHGSDVRLLDRSALLRAAARRVLRRAARVTTVSEFLAGDLAAHLPEVGDRLVVAPMPVDAEHFATGRTVPKATPPRILYAGNLVASKGVDVLLRACARLATEQCSFEVRVLGEGPERNRLRALANELGLQHRLTWAPFMGQERMPSEYGAATVTVLASRGRAEGLGLTLVEALMAGSAVVGTRVGGIPEVIVHEHTGLLARDGDAADLAAQLRRMLVDAELRSRCTTEGQRHVDTRFAAAEATTRFLSIYGEARAHSG